MSGMSQIEQKEMRAKKRANRMAGLKEKIKQEKAVLASKKRKVRREKKAASERRRMARVRSEQVAERKAVKEQVAYERSEREFIAENVDLFPLFEKCVDQFVIREGVSSLGFPVVFTLEGVRHNERLIISFTEKQYMTMQCYWGRLAEFEKWNVSTSDENPGFLLFPVADDKFEVWAKNLYESMPKAKEGAGVVHRFTIPVKEWEGFYKIKCDFFEVTR